MKEVEINKTFTLKGQTFKVVKDDGVCKCCHFAGKRCWVFDVPPCDSSLREDDTDVVFIIVKE